MAKHGQWPCGGPGVKANTPYYLIIDLLPELLAAVGQLDVEHQPADGLEASAGQPGPGVLLQNQGLPLLHHLGRDRQAYEEKHNNTIHLSSQVC